MPGRTRHVSERTSKPSKPSFNASISACEKGKQWEGALGLLQELVHKLLTPNVVSFSASISAYEKSKQWEGALGLLQEMVH